MHIRRTLAALTAAVTVGVLGSGLAQADDISNNLDSSIDATAEVMPLNVGGANGTTTLYVSTTNGDGKNGCNLTGSTTLTLSLSSSDTAVATVSPSSVTFTACGDTKELTVTPVAQGSATISATQTANTTGASFNLAPARFTVNVAPPANTAPTVSVTGVTGGASYSKGSVPQAICSVVDAEEGNSTFPATLSGVTGTYASDGIGEQTASCSYTDGGGLAASASLTYSIVDPSAPVIDYTLTPATPDGDNDWYRSDVALTWTISEAESPSSLVKVGCVDQVITSDQLGTTYSCSAVSAGGTAAAVTTDPIKRDATPPVVSHSSPAVPASGWYTAPVTATFTAADALSGVAGADSVNVSSGSDEEGAEIFIDGPAFSDTAGNTAAAGSAQAGPFKIDLTPPTAAFDSTLGGSYYFGQVPNVPTCTASDSVSGPAGCEVTGYSTAVGPHTLTATAMDNAGRTGTATQTYTVLAWTLNGFYQPVDMGGVLNTVKGGSTVPLKFEVFRGTEELTATTAIKSFTQAKIACDGSSPTDEVEATTTGGTSLRYDATGGQFVQNWQTPKTAGVCYRVTMTTQDGSSILANFKLK